MDRKILIKELNSLFCSLNKQNKKYTEVWLSDVDFGDLYQSNKYILNIKAEHVIDSCNDEIKEILYILDQNARHLLEYIWRVAVFDSSESIHCISDEFSVFSEATSC